MSITPTVHLNFRGQAREALEFYQGVFGGETTIVTYGEAHSANDPIETDQIIWGQVAGENGIRVMAYDVQAAKEFDRGTNSFYVSVRGTDADEVSSIWSRLSEGAAIETELGPSLWSPLYGMLADRFGITWVIDLEVAYAG